MEPEIIIINNNNLAISVSVPLWLCSVLKTCNFAWISICCNNYVDKMVFFLFYRHERLIDIKWVDFFLVGVSLARSLKTLLLIF